MDELTTKGLILKEQNIGERDKLVTVLTEERGVLRAFVRGAKSVKSKKAGGDHQVLLRAAVALFGQGQLHNRRSRGFGNVFRAA